MLSTCIKLPFVIKVFVLSIFEWPLQTGFTVSLFITFLYNVLQDTDQLDNREDTYLNTRVEEHRHITLLCGMSFVLVISNLSQLRITVSTSQHKHYNIILCLLLISLLIQCVIAICLLYASKKDMNPNSNKLEWSRTQKYHNMLLLFLAIISLLNISIFLLS